MPRMRPDVVHLSGKTLAELEAAAIRASFTRHNGNRARMRRELHISKTALLRKLDRLGLRNRPVPRHLTDRAIALAFFKHCHAITGELTIHGSTLMRWINTRAPFAVEE